MDERFYAAVELLKQMIETPSVSRQEQQVADLLSRWIEKQGYLPKRSGNNVWIETKHYSQDKPWVLLCSHLDTVKPVQGWEYDPYTATLVDDRIYGLGSNDAGAPLVSLLTAFLVLDQKEQPYNLLFLASCQEEVSGKEGVEMALSELPNFSFGVVGEPTMMQPAVSEKGLMVLDCTAFGRSGHAARNEGENALYKALDAINQFRNYTFEKMSTTLGPVKMTVTMIQCGTQHNVVPDECSFVVDVRSTDAYSNSEILELVKRDIPCRIEPRSIRLNSSSIPMEHPFVQRTLMLGMTPFGSPTLSDQALMNFPTVKIGPGDSARSHTADEYIEMFEIRQAIELYVRLLDGLSIK